MTFWRWRRSRVDPDNAWQRQNNEQQHNVLYKYINLQRQGRLVEVYGRDGLEALNAVIRDELGAFLYNDGEGKVVSKAEISGWKRECAANTKVSTCTFSNVSGIVCVEPLPIYSASLVGGLA